MIVEEGKKAIAKLIHDHFDKIDIGDGGDDTSSSQTTLDHSVVTQKTATKSVVGKQVVYQVEFAGSEISAASIAEIGIFANNTDATLNGDLLSRINFNSLGPFAASDTIGFSIVVVID